MSEADKNLVRRYAEEVVTQGKLDVVDEMKALGLGVDQGIPADGKPFELQEIWIFRVARGRLAERWFIADLWSRMKALGAEPVVPT